MKFKCLTALVLSLLVLAMTSVPAFAAEPNEVIDPLANQGYSDVTLEVKDTSGGGTDGGSDIIIATVPVELPIVMDLEGNITVPSNAKIINHVQDKDITVTKIAAVMVDGWSAADFSDDLSEKNEDAKELGLSFRGDTMGANGMFSLSPDNWNIAANGELALNMAAKLPKQTEVNKIKIATVSFTIDWASGGEIAHPTDFTVTANNRAMIGYSGMSAEDLEIPETFVGDDGVVYKVTSIGASAFNGCENLKSVVIPASVNSIGSSAFECCSNLERVTFHEGLESIGGSAFEKCVKLGDVVFPSTLKNVANFSFMDCTNLINVSLNDGIESIGMSTFSKTSVVAIHIPETLTSIGDYAFRTETLAEITIDSKNTAFTVADNVLFNKDMTTLVQCPAKGKQGVYNIPETVRSINSWAFAYTSDITSVTIPETVTSIGTSAFNRSGIGSIVIPSGLNNIPSSAFQNCSNLKTLTLKGAARLGMRAFMGCTNLTTVILDGGILAELSEDSFGNCSSLTGLTLHFPTILNSIHQDALRGCTGMKTITITDTPINTILGSAPWGAVNATVNYVR